MDSVMSRSTPGVLPYVLLALSAVEPYVRADTKPPLVKLTPAAGDLEVGPGMNAAGRDLRGCEFVGQDLTRAVFDGCNLYGVRIEQCQLQGASFRGAVFAGAQITDLLGGGSKFGGKTFEAAQFSELHGADFTDATINDAQRLSDPLSDLRLSPQQLMTTRSYKNRDLHQCVIYGSNNLGSPVALDLRGADLRQATLRGDLSNCDLTNAHVDGMKLQFFRLRFEQLASTLDFKQRGLHDIQFTGGQRGGLLGRWDFSRISLKGSDLGFAPRDADFSDARINGCTLALSKTQLYSTRSYKEGNLAGLRVIGRDLSGFDLSGINLTDCLFSHCKFADTNLKDAVITGAWFGIDESTVAADRLTLEQIKSTWNYRHGHMEGIRLPEELAEALRQEEDTKPNE